MGLLVHFTMAASIDVGNIQFSLTAFTPNMPSIEFENDTTPSDGAIQLTTNQRDKALNGSVGRATYYQPMHLWDNSSGNLRLADFTIHFSFSINSLNKPSGDRGDGFTFFLAPNGSKIPHHSGGGCLGLQSCDSDANSKFVAVEFDTFPNERWDPPTMSDHVAIDLNSVKTSFYPVEWLWSGIEHGGKVDAFITYNSSTKNLSVLLLDADDLTCQNSSSLSAILDLSLYLPEWVTFGFSGSTGSKIELHTIYSWNFNSSLQVSMNSTINSPNVAPSPPINPKRESKTWLWVVLAIAGGISALLLVMGQVWLFCRRRKYRRMREDGSMSVNVDMEMMTATRKFSYRELRLATNNFADECLLGEGGFGKVYLGFLRDIGSNIAVKRITPNSHQGAKEYESEITTIIRLRHRNLVQLIGWCHDNKEFLIVYEFLPNRSLDYHLHKEPCLLTWDTRYKIAMGVASGNVLLDFSFNAKLGDFGLARLVDHGQGSQTTKLILGTDGYIAPECLETYKTIKESDIYSFGIVALEIASGKKVVAVIERNGKRFKTKLVEWVWELYREERLLDAADPRLSGNYDMEQMERLLLVRLACAHPNYFDRPSIRQAIEILGSKAPLPSLPREMPVPIYIAALQDNIFTCSASTSSFTSASNRSQTQCSGTASSIHSFKDKTMAPGYDTEAKQ
ncbi:hypothetical protein ES288_A04G155500v1 [Gossypium darwinii]|uniref:non-specific serine/threonine protein kinase n=1 Tax=Gossypium darwinii TaxID=34276 RepID=A0A5D2GX25_GOSDA|nr:hypothetical protein ES288_A04G155500v1 [Gossypium darwinii]